MPYQPTKLPTIYLNREIINDKAYIKLYFKHNDVIRQRIKQNNWISFNDDLGAFAVSYSDHIIPLLDELFSDIAEINDFYLYDKPKVTIDNIGSGEYEYTSLTKRKNLEFIVLFPFTIEDIKFIGLKKKLSKDILLSIKATDIIIKNKEMNIWQFKATRGSFRRALDILMPCYLIKLNNDLTITDPKLKLRLYEQYYEKPKGFIGCPIEFIEYMQLHNYSESTLNSYHKLVLRYLNTFKNRN